jgi:hypothetical protein
MLPGFRFLFSAIILSMSVLIFGLGAAALLRSAHEEFANLPSRRSTPEPMFARLTDDQPPTLALVRVEPPVADQQVENVPAATVPATTPETSAPVGQAPDAVPVEPEKLAALTPAEPPPAEAAKPEASAEQASAEASAVAAKTEAPEVEAEVKIAAIASTPEPVAATPSAPAPEPTSNLPLFEPSIATTLIATLGGPAVIIEEKTSRTEAKPDRSILRKRAAERARERRRLAAARRARLAREATLTLQQQQPNPFAFPLTPTTR